MRPLSGSLRTILLATLPVLLLAALWLIARAPLESQMGLAQKIFYFHVPLAISAFAAFALNALASVLVLVRRTARWDRLAQASAETGLLFMTLVLVTGSIWARPIWNTWWTWEPRLTTALLLWFVYVAYFVLRSRVEEPSRRARAAAALGIIGFANVPVVYSSVFWLEKRYRLHPVVFTPGRSNLDPPMLHAFLASLAFMFILFLCLVWLRCRVLDLEERVGEFGERGAPQGGVLACFLAIPLLLQAGADPAEQWRSAAGSGAGLGQNWGYVVGAYAVIWIALLVYLLLLSRRQREIERRLERLEGTTEGRD